MHALGNFLHALVGLSLLETGRFPLKHVQVVPEGGVGCLVSQNEICKDHVSLDGEKKEGHEARPATSFLCSSC